MTRSVDSILSRRRFQAEEKRDQRVSLLYKKAPELKEAKEAYLDLQRLRIRKSFQGKETHLEEEKIKDIAARIQDLYAKYGINDNFFLPDYLCPLCEDTGYIEGQSCSCRNKLLLEVRYDTSGIKKQLEKENFSSFDLSLFRKDRQEGEYISPYENMAELLPIMKKYVKNFGKAYENLYFFGPTGVGKTFMIHCITKGILDKGFQVYYQTAPSLLDFLVQFVFMFEEKREKHQPRYDLIYHADLLVIDDLGTEAINPRTLAALFELINCRLIGQKPTVISSNLTPLDIEDYYDSRISSRILGSYSIFDFFGSDLRKYIRS